MLLWGSGVRWKCGHCVQCSAPPTLTPKSAWSRKGHPHVKLNIWFRYTAHGKDEKCGVGFACCSTCRSGSPVVCGWCWGQWGKPQQCSTEGSPADLLATWMPWLPLWTNGREIKHGGHVGCIFTCKKQPCGVLPSVRSWSMPWMTLSQSSSRVWAPHSPSWGV